MEQRYNLISTIIVTLVNILCIKLVIVGSGNEVYSIWSLINSYAAIVLVFISLNLTHYIGISIAVNKEGISRQFVKLMLVVYAFFIIFFFIYLLMTDIKFVIPILIIATSRYYYNIVKTIALFSKQMKKFMYFEATTNMVKLVVVTIFILIGYPVLGLTIAFTLPVIVTGTILIFSIKPIERECRYIGNISVLKICLPLMINTLLFTIIQNTDKIFLEKFGYFNEIAFYSALMTFYVFSTTIIVLFNSMIAAKIYNEKGNRQKIAKEIREFSNLYWFFSFLMLLFSKPIIVVLFDSSYLLIASLVPFIILGSACYYYYISYSNNLLVENKTNSILIVVIISTVVNLAVNISSIKVFGMDGAVLGFVITNFVLLVMVVYIVNRNTSSNLLNFKSEFKNITLNFMFFIVFCCLLNIDTIIIGLLSFVIILCIYIYVMQIKKSLFWIINN